ncbi:P-loop NTPase family protein [Gluconobacter wancherniae]|uniref:ABC transporter ATP-binding protein n=1 Tax=Gluconobacter wancherniae NBRC 103581 TaxID=656744 RepID=A0A511AXG1_9PROT|nr:ABC transporter ATP-binding protein [Gluconobacter wancherniae]MBF0853073.1 ABC transporter ATP-binding protein [Gluconobacter wancherniae]GBD56209.1 alpha-D-ribose 1-methylphosphonate 5-triphosphate synthase subunit PhnL [Gluconobacter wancherniae NBRC 103581]GBR63408.1 ABC transporter ATP-binding protein [Gluconobacter wancherniae NBRC 103581]GEK92889.1 hypothetical protein GWA01_06590 [Gluconobacter wancherniae NBRC 103581]
MAEDDLGRSALDPVLELLDARPRFDASGLFSTRYNLHLNPGECALIECRDPRQASLFADLCTGLIPLSEGSVRCMGLDWDALEDRRAWALRGRIGRMVTDGGWIDLYGTHLNILWPQMHHTRTPLGTLVEKATRLGIRFGLPGLPVLPPGRLSALDRRRADCVRAFLGEPSLLLLENPVEMFPSDLYAAFLSALTEARDRGCAVIWLAPDDSAWRGYGQGASLHLRLYDDGLFSMRGS